MTGAFHCPCGRALLGDPARPGQPVRCPACGREVLPGAPAALPPAVRTDACPGCGAALAVGAPTCPGCGRFVDPLRPPPDFRICPRCGAQVPRLDPTCRACGSLLAAAGDPGSAPAAPAGLPWEHRDALGWMRAGWDTLLLVLSRPSDAFRRMSTDGGLGHPLTFYALFQILPALLVYAFVGAGLLAFWIPFSDFLAAQVPDFPAGLSRGAAAAVYAAGFLLIPALNLFVLFLLSGLFHLSLLLFGGNRRGFAATFGCVAYCYVALQLVQLGLCCVNCIPYLGGCVGLLLLLAFLGWLVIALTAAHGTDTWRALLAVFGPLVLCGGAVLGVLSLQLLTAGRVAG